MDISARLRCIRDGVSEEENDHWLFVQTSERKFVVNVRLPDSIEYALVIFGEPANCANANNLGLLWNFLIQVLYEKC